MLSWFRSYLNIELKSSNSIQSTYLNWGSIKCGVPWGSILGHLLFIVCINYLLPTLRTSSKPIIFADDTSVIISGKNLDDFCMLSNKVLSQMCKWCSANKLVLNLEKRNVIQFITNSPQYPLNIQYNDKYIEEGVNKEFLGLQINNHLNSKNHVCQLMPELSRACYAVRSM
jgi:hypothetical protein